jgi:hypothetical protein
MPLKDFSTNKHSYIMHILETYGDGNVVVDFLQVHDSIDRESLVIILHQFGQVGENSDCNNDTKHHVCKLHKVLGQRIMLGHALNEGDKLASFPY